MPDAAQPPIPPLELERLKRSVKASLFAQPQTPVMIGKFRIERCIGQGGMGMVYSAVDEDLDRTVAIKLLRPELSGDDARLAVEAQALARLSHPNVVAIYEIGKHQGQRFFAMEYVQGKTLGAWLGGARSLDETIDVFLAAAAGLAAAHEVGLVHRDFKPDNVLVGKDGRPRILDFGLARPPQQASQSTEVPALPANTDPGATALTRDGALIGTPAYMAPEQHLGEPADTRSDQFSFAVSMYEAFHGSRPFRGDDLRTLSLAIVRGKLYRPEHPRFTVPTWLDAILERALKVSPENRFASIEELMAAIEQGRAHHGGTDASGGQKVPAIRAPNGLADHEVRDVAEQVGLDIGTAHTLFGGSETALAQTAPPGKLVAPPAPEHWWIPTTVSTSVELPTRPSQQTMALMARELGRTEGEEGAGEFIGESLAWSTAALDLRIVPSAQGATIILVRRLDKLVKKRLRRIMGLSAFLAVVLFGGFSEILAATMIEAMMGFFFFSFVIGGMAAGWSAVRWTHRYRHAREQEQLNHAAHRLLAIAEAERTGPETDSLI